MKCGESTALEVRLSPAAVRDLDEIRTYIAQDKPAAAERTVVRILQSLEFLGEFPRIGRVGTLPDTRELTIRGPPFRAIYRIEDDHVLVISVLHTSRRFPP